MANPIIINNWQQGTAPSPLVGFGNLVNVDIHGTKGVLQASPKAVNEFTGTAKVNWFAQDPDTGNIYALLADGTLKQRANSGGSWSTITGHGTSLDDGNGLGVYKGYIFKARREAVDVYNINTAVWTNDWATFTTQSNLTSKLHPMIHAQDDILYIGDGRYVSSVNAGASFVPGSDTLTAQALDLPQGYKILSLDEIGQYLAILAKQQNASRVAVFPWLRTTDSFNDPVLVKESHATSLLSTDNELFIQAGTKANVYNTNLSSYGELTRVDFAPVISRNPITSGNMTLGFNSSEMLLCVGESSGTTKPIPGLYSIKDGAISIKNLPSVLSSAPEQVRTLINNVFITSGGEILFSWVDNTGTTATGIDAVSNFRDRYEDYSSYVETQLYSVGTSRNPVTYQTVSVFLTEKLNAGDGFKIQYRTSLAEDWVSLETPDITDGDFDFDALGEVAEFHLPAGMGELVNVQFKILVKNDCKIDKIIIQ